MNTTKKILITFAVLLGSFFLTTFAFANNDDLQKAGDGVRNVVGDAENGLEDVANGVGGAVKDGLNTIGNGAKNVTDNVKDGFNNTMTTGMNNNNHDGGYGATRTATEATFAGMTGTTWTWFILAIAALAIVGLVWYYASQRTISHDRE